MIIHRLLAQRFGCLADCTVTFGPGLNVVSGPNESGKSTLQRALLLALLDRPARRKANEDWRQWGAGQLFQFELEYESQDGRKWVLSKDYERNHVRLAGDSAATTSWEEIQAVISRELGTCSPRALQSTCCIAQDELAAITEGRKEISHRLETLVTGGDDDTCTADAIAAVQRAAQALRRGLGARGAANPGPLATLTERKRSLEEQTASFRESLDVDDQTRQRLDDVRERLGQLEIALRPRLAAREAAKSASSLNEQLRVWREKESALRGTLERIADAEARISTATEGLADMGSPSLSDADYLDLARLHERVTLLRSQACAPQPPGAGSTPPAADPSSTLAWPTGVMPVATSIAAATALGGAAAAYGASAGLPTGVILAAIALSILIDIAGIGWLFFEYRHRSLALAAVQPNDTTTLAIGARPALPRLEHESQELEQRLARLGCPDWETLEAHRRDSRELLDQLAEAQSFLAGLLPPGSSREELEQERRAASLKRRDLEEALSAPAYERALRMGSVDYHALCQETDRLSAEREDLTAEATGLQARLEAARVTTEDLMAADERFSATTAELAHLEDTVAVYDLVLETMQSARERTLVRAQDQLAPLAGTYLAGLTGGRYTSIIIDSDLRVLLPAPGSHQAAVEPGRLSKGTQDQVFFALRLALMDLLFAPARPPLFLDDPFVKFDAERRDAALRLCQRIAQERQVILFTCSTEYERWGRVVVMPPRTPA